MSIFVANKSRCPICESPVGEGEEYYMFPAFVANAKDPIFVFNDQIFHLACLQQHPSGERAIAYSELCIERSRPVNRRCLISGKLIEDPDFHISTILLTSDETSFLHAFNFVHIDRRNLRAWEIRTRLIEELKKVQSSISWLELNGNDYLSGLIVDLSRE